MNRLAIIGNGFDLAHGLPTSYEDFLLGYIKKIVEDAEIVDEYYRYEGDVFINSPKELGAIPTDSIDLFYDWFKSSTSGAVKLKFNNKFLEEIFLRRDLEKWVDIEALYYETLKSSIRLGVAPI